MDGGRRTAARAAPSPAIGFFWQRAAFALLVTRIPAVQTQSGASDALLPVFLAAVPILAGVGSVATEYLLKRHRPGSTLREVRPVAFRALLSATAASRRFGPSWPWTTRGFTAG
jgi:hypothetical protein